MSKPELYMTLSATRRLALKGALACAFASAVSFPALAADNVLRVSAIPDEAPTELQRKFAPLGKYLEAQTGMKVVFTPVSDYAAVVESLATRKIDLAWLGGFTFVQAKIRTNGIPIPSARRMPIHLQVHHRRPAIKALADLKGKTFAFGAPSSTSGSLMPRFFLQQAGLNPEKDFKNVAFSGAHDATVAFVAAGKADAGVLNASVWDKLVEQKKVDTDKVRVFATTPPYFDYNWTVRGDLDPALVKKLTDAFLKLDPANPEHKEIMACSARRNSSRPRRKTTTASKRPPSRPAC
jgi:phosphonate transport system substrate-binding protein